MKEINQNRHEIKNSIIPFETIFNQETGTLLLNIDSSIPNLELKKAEAIKLGLSKKEEFHFTIIGSATGDKILKSLEGLSEVEKKKILDEINKLLELTNWKITLKPAIYHVQKEYNDNKTDESGSIISEKRQSIVQIANIEGLNEFYKNLNLLLQQQFDIPFPHLTLYTTSTREDKMLRGIGIYSKIQFEDLNPIKI